MKKTLSLLAWSALALAGACTGGDPRTTTDQNTRVMSDPANQDCPLVRWTETHTVVYDASGMVVSDTTVDCKVCIDADGHLLGDEVCEDRPPSDGTPTCRDDGSCSDPGAKCDPMTGVCVYPQPCEPVDSLPDDPSGSSCWKCDDGAGQTYGWCDVHACLADGSCADGYSVCDPATGLCVYRDPCQPVDSLPDDPSGSSCWQCDYGMGEIKGWCDIHSCLPDGSCADGYSVCDPATGTCVYQDPCKPVDSLPDDPTGSSCWQCDYGTGEVTGWCDVHSCLPDGTCADPGAVCDASGTCVYQGMESCRPVDSLPDDPTGTDCWICVGADGTEKAYCKSHSP